MEPIRVGFKISLRQAIRIGYSKHGLIVTAIKQMEKLSKKERNILSKAGISYSNINDKETSYINLHDRVEGSRYTVKEEFSDVNVNSFIQAINTTTVIEEPLKLLLQEIMPEEKVEIKDIEEPVCSLYKEDGYVGEVKSYLSLNDVRIQCKKLETDKYYLLWNNSKKGQSTKINIRKDGSLSEHPPGFFDLIDEQLDELAGWNKKNIAGLDLYLYGVDNKNGSLFSS